MGVNSSVLRIIAGQEVDKFLPNMIPAVRDDVITSVMRQWATCDGHAGLFTVFANLWLHLKQEQGHYHVGEDISLGDRLLEILRRSDAKEAELVAIVHELMLRQSATFETEAGVLVRVRAVPQEMRFEVERAEAEEE